MEQIALLQALKDMREEGLDITVLAYWQTGFGNNETNNYKNI